MKKQKFAQMEVNSSGIRVKGYFNLIKSYVYLLFFSVKMIPYKICCCNVDFICPQSLWNCCILIYYVFMFVQAEHTQNKPVLVVLFCTNLCSRNFLYHVKISEYQLLYPDYLACEMSWLVAVVTVQWMKGGKSDFWSRISFGWGGHHFIEPFTVLVPIVSWFFL